MSNAMSFMALITEYSSNNRDSLSPENLDELNLFIAKNGKTENVDTVYYCDEEKKYLWEYLGAKRMHIGITTKAEVVFKSPIKISGFYLFGYTDGSLQWKENDLPEHHADNPSSPEWPPWVWGDEIAQGYGSSVNLNHLPQHFLNLRPLPHGQGSLRPTVACAR